MKTQTGCPLCLPTAIFTRCLSKGEAPPQAQEGRGGEHGRKQTVSLEAALLGVSFRLKGVSRRPLGGSLDGGVGAQGPPCIPRRGEQRQGRYQPVELRSPRAPWQRAQWAPACLGAAAGGAPLPLLLPRAESTQGIDSPVIGRVFILLRPKHRSL